MCNRGFRLTVLSFYRFWILSVWVFLLGCGCVHFELFCESFARVFVRLVGYEVSFCIHELQTNEKLRVGKQF